MLDSRPEALSGDAMSHASRKRLIADMDVDISDAEEEASSDATLEVVAPVEIHFHWPTRFTLALPAECLARLAERARQGICCISEYSGYGSFEVAAQHIQEALRLNGRVDNESVGMVFLRSGDILERCRKALLGSHREGGCGCVFGDMLLRSPVELVDKMREDIKESHALMAESIEAGEASAAVLDKVGNALLQKVASYMFNNVEDQGGNAWCYAHERECAAVKTRQNDEQIMIGGAGITCIDWSSMGQKKRWVGDTLLCFMHFLQEVRAQGADAWILECTIGFDHDPLRQLLPSYELFVLKISPHELGLPSHRPRKYMFLLNRSRLRFQGKIKELGVNESFVRLFGRPVDLTGSAYFRAPQHVVNRMVEELATRRGLPSKRRGGKEWSCYQVLDPGARARLHGYEKRVVAMGLPERNKYLANIEQHPAFFKGLTKLMPTLMRRSCVWSFQHRRLLTGEESLEVQGMNLFNDDSTFACPFRDLVLSGSFSTADLKAMSGNSMNVAVVGACMVFLLGCTERV